MFKKDNTIYGCILGLIAPLAGLLLLKFYKYGMLNFKEVLQMIYYQPSHALMTAGLSVSLMMNAILFTIYINRNRDLTAKGIFITTVVYGVIILMIKYLLPTIEAPAI
jgi:predicted permease